jgi:ribosome-associated protein
MSPLSSPTIDTATCLKQAVAAAFDRKAIDLRVLDLAGVAGFTDFFLVCSGANRRQVQAIAQAITERLRPDAVVPLHVEGLDQAQWVLMDYGDFIVHILEETKREYYRLERLWADGPDVTREFVP